jgi:hypothetical protein
MVGALPSLARLEGRGNGGQVAALVKARVPGAPITGNELQFIAIGATTRHAAKEAPSSRAPGLNKTRDQPFEDG